MEMQERWVFRKQLNEEKTRPVSKKLSDKGMKKEIHKVSQELSTGWKNVREENAEGMFCMF